MTLQLDRTLLAVPPLIVTLAQVRYEERADNIGTEVAAALREPMADLDLPVFTQLQQQQFLIAPGTAVEAPARPVNAGWQFKSRDGGTVVTVMADQTSLETRRYAGWDSFKDMWCHVVNAVQATVQPTLVTRLGLRYVNRVQPRDVVNAAGWLQHDLVDPPFLGPAAGSPMSEFTVTVEGRAQMSFPGGVDALVHHGVQPEGEGQVFLLDIDCFRQDGDVFEVESMMSAMQELNDRSLQVFQSVIKDDLRREMLEEANER